MIIGGLYNQESAFFTIQSDKLKTRIASNDIISMTFTETIEHKNSGNIEMLDNDHFYSRLFPTGSQFTLEFGYSTPDTSLIPAFTLKSNPKQLNGDIARRGIKCVVQSPGGAGSQNGVSTFNLSFIQLIDQQINVTPKVYSGMSKTTFIQNILLEMGCNLFYVDFVRGDEFLNSNNAVIQYGTNYKLLLQLAREWQAIFTTSYTPSGQMTAIFVSPQNLSSSEIPKLMSGAIGGDSIFLEYKQGVNNVLSYTWQDHAADGGSGSSVTVIPGNPPQIYRRVSSTDTVQLYRLDYDKLSKDVATDYNKTGGSLVKDLLAQGDFNNPKVQKYFVAINQQTAPEGLGYSMTAKCIGNPLMSAPLKVVYGKGFPPWFTPLNENTHPAIFYAKKVEHRIDMTGYKMDLEIQDAFTLSGGSLVTSVT